jgi:hypothetical protein
MYISIAEMTVLEYLRQSLKNFCLGWPQTTIILISTFQVAGITGTFNYAQPKF